MLTTTTWLLEPGPKRVPFRFVAFSMAALSVTACSSKPTNLPAAQQHPEGASSSGNIALNVDGKKVTFPVNAMNDNHVKRGRDEFPDWFEFEGEGISLFGVFWIGFEEQWDQLVNKPLEIRPSAVQPEDGESRVDLPGQPGLKVQGGTVVVEEVVETGPRPVLRGRLSLKVETSQGVKTLEGTFQAPVETWD